MSGERPHTGVGGGAWVVVVVSVGGGGHVGLLLISSFVKAGTTAVSTYNHDSLLRSIEDLFQLEPTGYAGFPGVLAFDSVVYNAPATSS